jgi:DNA modification methylase
MSDRVTLLHGDCLEEIRALADSSIDSVVTDPPYALVSITKRFGSETAAPAKGDVYARASRGFMGKTWDTGEVAFAVEFWREVLRVLKPGGHVLAFGGTRTYHRLVCAIEDAGFEIRDQVAWVYGSGFPKSHDVSKGIDKAAGAEREVIGPRLLPNGRPHEYNIGFGEGEGFASIAKPNGVTAPATPEAIRWQGWGTALKPAWETVCLAQKPYELETLCDTLAQELMRSLCRLASSARDAGTSSSSNPSGSGAEFGSAQWSAVAGCNTPADLFALMGTLPSGLAIPSNLSIGLSWLGILADLSKLGSTFTIETRSSLITDLRTLNCSPFPITPAIITEVATRQGGLGSSAAFVVSLFNGFASRLNVTRALSALGSATSPDRTRCPAEEGLSPAIEPICLARKPLSEGTVAANVLRWGTGAINVDGCRVEANGEAGINTRASSREAGTGWGMQALKTEDRSGRWPANLIHDGSDEVVGCFPETRDSGNLGGTRRPSMGYHGNGAGDQMPPSFGDPGSAARFFKAANSSEEELLFSRAMSICEEWNNALANTADNSSSLSRQLVASVLSDAATWVAREGNAPSRIEGLTGLSTSVTPSELRRLSESFIAAMLLSESGRSPVPMQEKHIPNGCRVSVAAIRKPTGIITITISHWRLDGSAEPVTFNITPLNSERGAKVSGVNRIHYCAKASRKDRDAGLEGMPEVHRVNGNKWTDRDYRVERGERPANAESGPRKNIHPTVKPTSLMQYLCRLVTPSGGVVLDPFMGSGSTGRGALLEGFRFVGIEREAEYIEIARRRIADAERQADVQPEQPELFAA